MINFDHASIHLISRHSNWSETSVEKVDKDGNSLLIGLYNKQRVQIK
jgi:hypothetical protein